MSFEYSRPEMNQQASSDVEDEQRNMSVEVDDGAIQPDLTTPVRFGETPAQYRDAIQALQKFRWILSTAEHSEREVPEDPTSKMEHWPEHVYATFEDYTGQIEEGLWQDPEFWRAFLSDDSIWGGREFMDKPDPDTSESYENGIPYQSDIIGGLWDRLPQAIKNDPTILPLLLERFDPFSNVSGGHFGEAEIKGLNDPTIRENPHYHRGNEVNRDLYYLLHPDKRPV